MNWVGRFLGSSIGLKFVMALTGIGLFGFLIGYMLGNLLIFKGADALNAYAKGLKELPFGLLWVARIGLVTIFGSHLYAAVALTRRNRAARPDKYAYNKTIQASFASRYMIQSGLLVLAFLLYHLAHFTFQVFDDVGVLPDGSTDVYGMVIAGFGEPYIACIYIFSMVILGLHLSHGLSSVFQTLGLRNQKYLSFIEIGSKLFAGGLAFANISIPLSVWLGLIR